MLEIDLDDAVIRSMSRRGNDRQPVAKGKVCTLHIYFCITVDRKIAGDREAALNNLH